LCPNVNKDNTNRVSFRRKYAFQDYVDAHKNPRRQFKENATLKVIFIGEPAVDDGGSYIVYNYMLFEMITYM
jgi:hypothetical protein